MAAGPDGALKGRHFTSKVVLWALRWYLVFPISYRDLAAMLSDRSIAVDHTTLFLWVQAYAGSSCRFLVVYGSHSRDWVMTVMCRAWIVRHTDYRAAGQVGSCLSCFPRRCPHSLHSRAP